jgi:GNAT superfamily N-acetyltransferase
MTTGNTQAASTRYEIVRAGEADTDALAQVISEAFFPLAVCQWLIPDPTARRAAFLPYFRLYAEHAIADGLIETTPDRAAAALWIPGTGPGTPPADYPGRLAAITGPHLSNFQAFDQALDAHHPAGTFHHHLAILAVHPDAQGQGIGTALLHAHHTTLDQDGTPAYLEASDERTRRVYLNHGYTDHGSPVEFADGVQMYPMVRHPQPGRSALHAAPAP